MNVVSSNQITIDKRQKEETVFVDLAKIVLDCLANAFRPHFIHFAELLLCLRKLIFSCIHLIKDKTVWSQTKNQIGKVMLVTRPAEDEPVAVVADVDLEHTLSASSSSSSEFWALFLALLSSATSFLRLPRRRFPRRLPLPLLADTVATVVLPLPGHVTNSILFC